MAQRSWQSDGDRVHRQHLERLFAGQVSHDKFPASLVLMELSKQLELYDLDLKLAWIPREQNDPADDLSKDRFEKFDSKCRVEVDMTKLNYLVLPKMLEAAMSLDEEMKPSFADKAPADKKLRLTQPW